MTGLTSEPEAPQMRPLSMSLATRNCMNLLLVTTQMQVYLTSVQSCSCCTDIQDAHKDATAIQILKSYGLHGILLPVNRRLILASVAVKRAP